MPLLALIRLISAFIFISSLREYFRPLEHRISGQCFLHVALLLSHPATTRSELSAAACVGPPVTQTRRCSAPPPHLMPQLAPLPSARTRLGP